MYGSTGGNIQVLLTSMRYRDTSQSMYRRGKGKGTQKLSTPCPQGRRASKLMRAEKESTRDAQINIRRGTQLFGY